MYINTQTNQYPISEQDIRYAFPNTSFSTPFTAPEEYAWVFPTPQPAFNEVTQMSRELAPVLTVKGIWEQQWEVITKFTKYTDENDVVHTVAEQESAAIAQAQATQVKTLQESVIHATQLRLDNFARTRNYDGILSACTYATSSIANFQTEGQYAVNARDSTWAALYAIMGEVQAGTRPTPAGFADIEADLPVLAWPA